MASGLIGTSTIGATPPTPGTSYGQTLSYTCPASGVRYAVITISAQASVVSTSTSATCLLQAGGYASASAGTSAGIVSSSANTVQIILAPGQSWSDSARAYNNTQNAFAGIGEASLTASVLEIV